MNAKRLSLLGSLALAMAIVQPARAQLVEREVAETGESQVVTVKVENRNWLDMRVYAVISGIAHRLGTVGSFNEEEFTLRESWIGPSNEVQLVSVPIGQRRINYAQSLLVGPGDYVEYRIENSLSLSYAVRY